MFTLTHYAVVNCVVWLRSLAQGPALVCAHVSFSHLPTSCFTLTHYAVVNCVVWLRCLAQGPALVCIHVSFSHSPIMRRCIVYVYVLVLTWAAT